MPMAPRSFRLHPKPAHSGKSAATIERCKKYRTKGWEQIRTQVLARDGMQCQECQRLCIGKGEAHVDHIVAVVDGGTDEAENLILRCQQCHSRKTAKNDGGFGNKKHG
jgi:5-methylcytosine-specific restriction protein A